MLNPLESRFLATGDMKIKGKRNVYVNGKTKPSNAVQAYSKIANGLAKQMAEMAEKQK